MNTNLHFGALHKINSNLSTLNTGADAELLWMILDRREDSDTLQSSELTPATIRNQFRAIDPDYRKNPVSTPVYTGWGDSYQSYIATGQTAALFKNLSKLEYQLLKEDTYPTDPVDIKSDFNKLNERLVSIMSEPDHPYFSDKTIQMEIGNASELPHIVNIDILG